VSETRQPPRTLPQLLEQAVDVHSSRAAIITRDERISYAELSQRVERSARSLVALGVGKGSHVGLLMENRPEWVVLAFAATSLGALLVPVSTFSRADDLAYQLRHADVSHLLMSARFLKNDYLGMLRKIAPELELARPGGLYSTSLPALREVVVLGDEDLPKGCRSWADFEAGGQGVPEILVRSLRTEVDPEDDCYLLYTSGTTARPKGVLHVHDAVARNGWSIAEYQHLVPGDVAWFYFPLFFSAGCINVMLGSISHGAAMIVQRAFEPTEALELIEREKANTWHLWAHTLKALTDHPDWKRRDHSRLHKGTAPFDVLFGGPPEDGLGGVNMYGMTETCTAFSCTPADMPLKVRLTSNGPLMAGNEIKIVDPDSGARLPVGQAGEICVKGPSVLRRYYKIDPATTFDAEGFFHTGDLGLVDEQGHVRFQQRIKDMIKTGGINVSPAEIEMKLVKMEAVDVAHAFPLPAGEKGEVVGAALVVRSSRIPSDAEILAFCEEALPGPKRPQAILVLAADQVPMTGSGKVQKVVLRDRLLAGVQESGGPIVRLL